MLSNLAVLTINVAMNIAIVMLAMFERYVKYEADHQYRTSARAPIGLGGYEREQGETRFLGSALRDRVMET